MNIREIKKERRINRIRAFYKNAKEEKKNIDLEKLISILIIEENISRRTATEEINAVKNYE